MQEEKKNTFSNLHTEPILTKKILIHRKLWERKRFPHKIRTIENYIWAKNKKQNKMRKKQKQLSSISQGLIIMTLVNIVAVLGW